MDGMKGLKSGFERDCHGILNAVAAAVTAEIESRAGLLLPGPTGKSESAGNLKVRVVYQGPATQESRDAVREVMARAGNASEMVRLMKQVGLG